MPCAAGAPSTFTPATLLFTSAMLKFMRASRPAEFNHSSPELE